MKDYTIDGKSVPELLKEAAQKGNPAFTTSLHPGVENVLGCRMGDLRKLAKAIASTDWQQYLRSAGTRYMEERTLYGLVLGYILPTDFHTYLKQVDTFVRRINSWSVCDSFSFAGGKAFVTAHEEELWTYLTQKMQVREPYAIRFGVVMAMRYFTDKVYLSSLLKAYDQIHCDHYYVRMAVAWAIAECFTRFPAETMRYLHHNRLDDFTFNKALQKITESLRVDKSTKIIIRQLKRKL